MANAQGASPVADGRKGKLEGFGQFLQETWAELHRVEWPKRSTIIKHTVVVVSTIVFMALYIGALDLTVSWLFTHVLKVTSG